MEQGHFAPLPGLGGDRDGLAHVLQTSGVSEVAAGQTPVAQRPWRAVQAKLLREREDPLGVMDPGLGPSLKGLRDGYLGERADELGAGRQRFEERHRLRRQLRPSRIPVEEHHAERGHGVGGSREITSRTERRDRLV